MNTKRQTVWLVSMLSIMVVLSAYYLFTNDVNDMDVAGEKLLDHHIVIDEIDEHTHHEEVVETGRTDEEILQQVQSQGQTGTSFFTSLYLEREEKYSKEVEALMTMINETDSTETQTEAFDKLHQIDDKVTKLSYLEGLLMKDYEYAIVSEDNDQWKVIVKTDHMEKSQAVSIIDLVMQEMNANPNQVVVELKQ